MPTKNNKNKYELLKTRSNKETSTYSVAPYGIGKALNAASVNETYGKNSETVFNEDGKGLQSTEKTLSINSVEYKYVCWGTDDMLPYHLMALIGDNLVISRCLDFNITSCYGQGVRFIDRDNGMDTKDNKILDWCLHNNLHRLFMEQCTDMKFFDFAVLVIALSRDGKQIVSARHRDACYCRFEKADANGCINHVFYGDWRVGNYNENAIEAIPLLNEYDPLGDLKVRLGQEPDPKTGSKNKETSERKFAIVCKMPSCGQFYYPMPSYLSIFRDAWNDIYRLIGIGKRFMIKNTSAPRIQIEVHNDYWDNVCDNENIFDEVKRAERKKEEKQNIIDFVTGPENAGKALVSGYYVDPNGKENRMVRIINLNDTGKEGGDWAEDGAEAANFICFAMGVHPNLVGATPGKSQMNNSGSDKRELFTLKQALEKPTHDILCQPYHTILHFNGWAEKNTVDVPMLMLTTLDENKDAKKVTGNGDKEINGNNDDDNGNK